MTKKIIFISISVIFFLAAATGIGWIIKKEIENGKMEYEQQAADTQYPGDRKNDGNNNLDNDRGSNKEVIVSNKAEANKALEDVDSIVNSLENDL